jgi:hypothetical protein
MHYLENLSAEKAYGGKPRIRCKEHSGFAAIRTVDPEAVVWKALG